MKRVLSELKPSVGLNFCDGFQATSVCKPVATGGKFLTYGKKLPKYVTYEGAAAITILVRACAWITDHLEGFLCCFAEFQSDIFRGTLMIWYLFDS